jgi:succinoglycan biosynthesis protein ExoM
MSRYNDYMENLMTNAQPTSDVDVNICICTFRRPHLAKTLESLASLNISHDTKVSVIIADNDETPSAEAQIKEISKTYRYPISYVHAPARNISIARNACIEASKAKYVAFIDDDEIADPNWLNEMITVQTRSQTDVVLGLMQSQYPTNCPQWIKDEDMHSSKPAWVNGKIVTGYTSNVLFVRTAPPIDGLRFDPNLGQSGGEDTLFFSTIHKRGGLISYAPRAVITEDVTPERLSLFWLLKRYFRAGQTHGLLLIDSNKINIKFYFVQILAAASKVFYCGIMALGNFMFGKRGQYWLIRGALHVGVIARLSGIAELTQYG